MEKLNVNSSDIYIHIYVYIYISGKTKKLQLNDKYVFRIPITDAPCMYLFFVEILLLAFLSVMLFKYLQKDMLLNHD
jgi:hypothetical protein